MDILSNFSERLKDLMTEAEIKAKDLAKNTNLEPSVISKFTRGERLPSAPSLVVIADYFNCTTDYLLGLSDILDDRTFKHRPPFCEQLNFLLDAYHITKYRLEKETKLTEETVNRWQKGKYEPTVESLIRLAKYFNCSVDYILGREN